MQDFIFSHTLGSLAALEMLFILVEHEYIGMLICVIRINKTELSLAVIVYMRGNVRGREAKIRADKVYMRSQKVERHLTITLI